MASHLAHLPVLAQVAAFEEMVSRNPVIAALLPRLAALDLPHWYLTAGCLFQTVWNELSGRPPTAGILDYDVFSFDPDVSWEAEDRAIRRAAAACADLGADVQVRNQARVHLWYEGRFGVACAPFRSTEAGIDAFPATTCCLAVRLDGEGRLVTYAPHGFADLFAMVVRPNPVLAPRSVYEAKTARWAREWPDLSIFPWRAS